MNTANISSRLIEEIVLNTTSSAHFKDYNSLKYVFSNKINFSTFGFNSPDRMVGYSLWDLNCTMSRYWGENFAKEVDELYQMVGYKKVTVIDTGRILVLPNDTIKIHDSTKIPVLNSKNKISGILTISEDKTTNVKVDFLLNIYVEKFSKFGGNYAISRFLSQIGIVEFFSAMPTFSELRLILTKFNYPFHTNKQIATLLHVSPRTVQSQLYNIENKISKSMRDILFKIKVSST